MGSRIVEASNCFGGCGPEMEPAKERILFLSDSFCEGDLVGDEELSSAVLARQQPQITPLNLGVAGYSTGQAYLLDQRLGPKLQPHRVVLLFFDNDVWFNSVTIEHRAPKPAFALTPNGLRLTGVSVPPPAHPPELLAYRRSSPPAIVCRSSMSPP